MIPCRDWIEVVRAAGVRWFAGVPCSLLEPLCSSIQAHVPRDRHLLAVNEGGAVAWAIGSAVGSGELPLVYLQNSGLGHALNPIASLAHRDVYGVGLLLVVGWRGEPGEPDEPQHRPQGQATRQMLASLGLRTEVLERSLDAAAVQAQALIAHMRDAREPVALLIRRQTFEAHVSPIAVSSHLSKNAAILTTLSLLPEEAIVVASTGKIAREVAYLRTEKGLSAGGDFLVVGGMGHASSIALGLAETSPGRLVCCLDGDGAALMHLGALAIIGQRRPGNFLHLVLNDGVHDSVGGQPTVARAIDMAAVARGCGYAAAARIESEASLRLALASRAVDGPTLLDVHVSRDERAHLPRPQSSPRERVDALRARLS